MPEPISSTKPIAIATSSKVVVVAWVSGNASKSAPMISNKGTTTQRRPIMPMTLPAR